MDGGVNNGTTPGKLDGILRAPGLCGDMAASE